MKVGVDHQRVVSSDKLTEPVVEYYDTIDTRRVVSNVEPGYLKKILPDGIPAEGEAWEDIQKDVQDKIMPGLTHW